MLETTARNLVGLASAYLVIGVGFAIPFVIRWAGRLDPAARAATRGFRVVIVPGAVLLWPALLFKLVRTR